MAHTQVTSGERAWTIVRLTLGMMQMAGATIAIVLLVRTGVSTWSVGAAVTTSALTTLSVLLLGSILRRESRNGHRIT